MRHAVVLLLAVSLSGFPATGAMLTPEAEGFDPAGADGMFAPRTRAAIRSCQTSRAARATARPSAVPPVVSGARQQPSPPPSADQENLFWQSIVNSTDPADFEAYLEVFPNGVFRRLAENRLAALRAPSGPASGGNAPRRRPGDVFRDCAECPEMVVMTGGRPAMGRYEVTRGEYRAFVSATGGTGSDWWQHTIFLQTDRHPVVNVSWDDAQAYVSWLSQRTGAAYRLPSEAEWEQAAEGTQRGCHEDRTGRYGTCPVGSHGSNAQGLSDMFANVMEWTSGCSQGDCSHRVIRGGAFDTLEIVLEEGVPRINMETDFRIGIVGFRVSRMPDWSP